MYQPQQRSVPSTARLGAPLVTFERPTSTSPSGQFLGWVEERPQQLKRLLEALRSRHRLPTTFLAVNFEHPDLGPGGSAVFAILERSVVVPRERYQRLMTIPYQEFGDAPRRWRRGEIVLLGFDEMSPELQIRFAPTPLRWSLNVPLLVDGDWVGIVGANTTSAPPGQLAIDGFSALAEAITSEFEADRAHLRFLNEIDGPALAEDPPHE